MSSGIRYVPRHQRRGRGRGPERLHGAFTGGFSAGHFNTVDTPEGWQPANNDTTTSSDQASQPQQSLQDFMDEQDHNEWGGPTGVRPDVVGTTTAAAAPFTLTTAASLTKTVFGDTDAKQKELILSHVGSRLLQKMGWRPGSQTAIVPADPPPPTTTTTTTTNDDKDHPATTQQQTSERQSPAFVLSQRRLRKIRVQQAQVPIPRPKLDHVGLGFEAHANAPEFQAFRQKQQRLARARRKGGDRGSHRDVYRLSNVLGGEDAKPPPYAKLDHAGALVTKEESASITHRRQKNRSEHGDMEDDNNNDDNHGHYDAYADVQDFVGSRTVGGFALRDDEDDAFDDHHAPSQQLVHVSDKLIVDQEEYDIVLGNSDSEDDDKNARSKDDHAEELAEGLFAWTDTTTGTLATTDKGDGNPTTCLVTSDGRPPLPGFVLGGSSSSSSNSTLQRFRGPDIPEGYDVAPHVFRDEEHPMVWKTLARAVQLETDQARKDAAVKDALASSRIQQKRALARRNDRNNNNPPEGPLAGTAFSSLASAMKNRFTSSTSDGSAQGDKTALPAGLVPASAIPKATNDATSSEMPSTSRNFTLTRSVQSFAPVPLLCKRFGVRAPTLNSTAVVPKQGDSNGPSTTSREESFFNDEVLAVARQAKENSVAAATNSNLDNAETLSPPPPADAFANRPSMEVYRSIFGEHEDEEESDSESSQSQGDAERLEETQKETSRDNLANAQQSEKEATGDIVPVPEMAEPALRQRHAERRENTTTWTSDSSQEASVSSRKKSSRERKRRRKHEKKKKKKKKKHRKREWSDDDSLSEVSSAGRERKRSRKHRRKDDRKATDKPAQEELR